MAQSRMGRILACACSLALALQAIGATIHVPEDFPTIQQAIDMAGNGSTIVVAPGTYIENLVIEFKAITLESEYGPAATTVQALDGQNPVLEIFLTDSEGLVAIDGFTFAGGKGGVVMAFAQVLIDNCVVEENPGGSGVDIFWSNVTITDSAVSLNGGSEVPGGGILADFSHLSLQGTSVTGNRGSIGGGLTLIETFVGIEQCTFEGNEGEGGGGIYVGLATVSISETVFLKNIALDEGGAVKVADAFGTTVAIEGCSVQGNMATIGGGIWIGDEAEVDIGQTQFCNNQVEHITGGWDDQGGNTFNTTCHVGDINGDGVVDVSDLFILLAAWGSCPRSGDCPADLNGDGVVDVSDLLILLANWG